jgi:lipopolysaccharide biosynthesis protein
MSWSYLNKARRRLVILKYQLTLLPQDLSRQISTFRARGFSQSETEIPLKVLVIVNAYWPEQFATIIKHLNQIKMPLSVVVTIPHGEHATQIEELIPAIYKHHCAKAMRVENAGRDIGPFLKAINTFGNQDWDLVIKVHTKASQNIWFETLVKSLLRSDRRIQNYASLLKKFPKGVIVHPLFRYPGHRQLLDEPAMEKLRSHLFFCEFSIPKEWYFAAGTMFAATPEVLIELKNEGEKIFLADFEAEDNYSQSSLAHVYERFIGLYVCARGDGLISTSIVDFFDFKALQTKLR